MYSQPSVALSAHPMSVRKVWGFVKNVMQQLSQEDEDSTPLAEVQSQLVENLQSGQDCIPVIEQLIACDLPLDQKYTVLRVGQLLKLNNKVHKCFRSHTFFVLLI